MAKFIDLTGENIGDWEVIEYAGKSMWRCKCKCGKEKLVDGKSLRNGKSKSCGLCAGKKERNARGNIKIYLEWYLEN